MKYKVASIQDLTEYQVQLIKNSYPNRYEKALKYKFEDDFKRCILGYCLLIDLVGKLEEKNIFFNEFNKPFLCGGPDFSISHSGDLVAVAINNGLVGVDIQKIDEKNLKLSKVFTNEEKEWINEKDSVNRFHVLWAQKESAMKLIGKGLTMKFDEIVIKNKGIISTPIGDIKNTTEILEEGYVFSLSYRE